MSLDLGTSVGPWYMYLKVQPKPVYENERAIVYWDILWCADTMHVTVNRIDAAIIDKESKTVSVIEMTCPWAEYREAKTVEET